MSSDELTEIAQKATRGGMFLLIGNASSTVILAAGAILIARLLGPSSYGAYSLALLVPLLFVSFADAGMNSALVRFTAKLRSQGDLNRARRMIRLGFLFKLCLSMVFFVICYEGAEIIAISILNRPELSSIVQLASVLIVFQAVYDAAANSLIGLELMQVSGIVQVLQSILKSLLAVMLILIGFGVAGAISGYVVSTAAAGMVATFLLFVKYSRPTRAASDSLSELMVILRYGVPLYSAAIVLIFLRQYQSIVMAHFASNLEIGNFTAASNFTTLLDVLAYPIATAMLPMFSKMDPRSRRSELSRAFELSVKYPSLLIIPASVAIMILSRDLVFVVYGAAYVLAPSYLIVLCSVYFLTLLGSMVIGILLSAVADTAALFKMNILTLALFLPLGPTLMWSWGIYGLIIALVLANAVGVRYGVREASRKYGVRLDLRANGKVLLAALAAAIPSILLFQAHVTWTPVVNLIIGGLLYLVAYLTLAPVLGAVSRSDIDNLEVILHKTPVVATLTKPLLAYETWILSVMGLD